VEAIAPKLLGLGLDEIGHAAALHWGLPAGLMNGMRTLAPRAGQRNQRFRLDRRPVHHGGRLCRIAVA
jgi:hypothetical protein